jgi:hypothetical protein
MIDFLCNALQSGKRSRKPSISDRIPALETPEEGFLPEFQPWNCRRSLPSEISVERVELDATN